MSEYIEICPACLEPCRVVTVDMGIGAYEYWGAKGVDVHLCTVTECCEVEPLELPYIKGKDVEQCHLNEHGSTPCSVCPFVEYCMDALPLEDEA